MVEKGRSPWRRIRGEGRWKRGRLLLTSNSRREEVEEGPPLADVKFNVNGGLLASNLRLTRVEGGGRPVPSLVSILEVTGMDESHPSSFRQNRDGGVVFPPPGVSIPVTSSYALELRGTSLRWR